MNETDPLGRAEELLARLEGTRARLDEIDEPEQAIDVLGELAEIARAVEAELQRVRREAGAADA